MPEYLNVPDRSLFIGDNLEVLRGINSDAVDFVYLDPPRNSGRRQPGASKTMSEGVSYGEAWSEDDMRPEWIEEIGVRRPDVLMAIDAAKVLHGPEMAGYLTFMGIRLLEIHRVLKPSGSIYLQCDPHTVHYLRMVMDAAFGRENFKNEISWRRDRLVGGTRRWGWHHDTILFYAGPRAHRWNRTNQEPPPEYWSNFVYEDDRGRYYTSPLIIRGRASTDDAGEPWQHWHPGPMGRRWSVPMDLLQTLFPEEDLGSYSTQEKLEILAAKGFVVQSWMGLPRFKRYEQYSVGTLMQDVVTTIPPVRRQDREYRGWPGQKPQALLDLLIGLSTDPENPEISNSESAKADIVLDPFCGSGTACVAAELARRRWIGIERAPQSAAVLRHRLDVQDLPGPLVFEAVPGRTDLEEVPADISSEEIPYRVIPGELEYPTVRPDIYNRQGGRCQGCNHAMPEHALLVDRLESPKRGQEDSLDNLVLVCHRCRTIRMSGSLEHLELENRRRETYWIPPTST